VSTVRRTIRNVFVDRGDADDLAASLKRAALRPKVHRRTVSAERIAISVYVVTALEEP
jgi:hypothetical protein